MMRGTREDLVNKQEVNDETVMSDGAALPGEDSPVDEVLDDRQLDDLLDDLFIAEEAELSADTEPNNVEDYQDAEEQLPHDDAEPITLNELELLEPAAIPLAEDSALYQQVIEYQDELMEHVTETGTLNDETETLGSEEREEQHSDDTETSDSDSITALSVDEMEEIEALSMDEGGAIEPSADGLVAAAVAEVDPVEEIEQTLSETEEPLTLDDLRLIAKQNHIPFPRFASSKQQASFLAGLKANSEKFGEIVADLHDEEIEKEMLHLSELTATGMPIQDALSRFERILEKMEDSNMDNDKVPILVSMVAKARARLGGKRPAGKTKSRYLPVRRNTPGDLPTIPVVSKTPTPVQTVPEAPKLRPAPAALSVTEQLKMVEQLNQQEEQSKQKISTLEKKITQLEKKNAKLQLTANEGKVKLKAGKKSLQDDVRLLKAELDGKNDEISFLKSDLSSRRFELEQQVEINIKLGEENIRLERVIADLETHLLQLKKKINLIGDFLPKYIVNHPKYRVNLITTAELEDYVRYLNGESQLAIEDSLAEASIHSAVSAILSTLEAQNEAAAEEDIFAVATGVDESTPLPPTRTDFADFDEAEELWMLTYQVPLSLQNKVRKLQDKVALREFENLWELKNYIERK
jgi:hypothetical protein